MTETEPPTKAAAISALGQLGLSKYEAAVFIALCQLETGTASEVDRITDVPRSQVYGAAERLQELGLIDVQQSNPIQYRAIGLETARARLRARLEQKEQCAFDYLESVRGEHAVDNESQVSVWTASGRATIDDRIVDLVSRAEDRVVFGAPNKALVSDAIVETLTSAANEIDVTVISEEPAVCDAFADAGIEAHVVPEEMLVEEQAGRRGRLLVVDRETVLLSTLSGGSPDEESAIWSDGTSLAAVVIGLLDDWFEQSLGEASQ